MEKGGMNRREFVVKGGLGLMTAALGMSPLGTFAKETTERFEIPHRVLGRTGLRIPPVSFGVMNSDSSDLIRKGLDLGLKHLDTAHGYLRGNSERVIGEVLMERGCRDRVYLATKMFFARDNEKSVFLPEGSGRSPGATERNLNEQIAESLKRLRTDYVDILYLHSCHGPLMPAYEPMMQAFVRTKESGKARFIGVSTHAGESETIRAAVDAGIWDVVLTSYNFMQDHGEEVKNAIAYAASKGVGIVAMKTQGGVKLNQEKKVEVNHAAALRWVLNDKNVCTAIPGMTTFEQMELDFGVMKDLMLSEEEKRDLKISSLLRGTLYCQQCGYCANTCPRRVEIPTLMRAYMYAEGYGNPFQADLTLGEVQDDRGLKVCLDCNACTAVCRRGIDIRRRLNSLMADAVAGKSV